MSQHYPLPNAVLVPPKWLPTSYGLRKMKAIIERDGLIVPILVRRVLTEQGGETNTFEVADEHQAERVIACRELGFETILVETEWDEDDL